MRLASFIFKVLSEQMQTNIFLTRLRQQENRKKNRSNSAGCGDISFYYVLLSKLEISVM